jgi:hypothetical protein
VAWRYLDDSRWPIVVGTFPGFPDIEAYLSEVRECIARERPYVMITDASRATGADSRERRALSAFMAETREASERLCLGSAVIVSGPFARGALTALFWASHSKVPLQVARNLDEALALAIEWVAVEGEPKRPRG